MSRVDLAKYAGREQAYVKHYLLEEYLSTWGYKVGNSWDSLVYVDGFAGPWGSTDVAFADSSFAIATRVLKQVIGGLRDGQNFNARGLCVFVEKDPSAFTKLREYVNSVSGAYVRAVALEGSFVENIPKIESLIKGYGSGAFKFVFLDQKGWAATPMGKVQPFLQSRSCEVLFNLMTSFLTRFVDTDDREFSYHELFGRPDVLDKIRSYAKGTGEREEAAVREYCKSLREKCGFRYVSEAVILEPEKEKVRYYLIFATNHHKGIEVFKSAEMKAAKLQEQVRHQTQVKKTRQEEFDFGDGPRASMKGVELRESYCATAREQLIKSLTNSQPSQGVAYRDLYCEAMALPLVTPSDLERWLRELIPNITIRLSGSSKRRKPHPDADDRVFVVYRHCVF